MTIRICLAGVESTGKSTLAPRLAARFGGVVMPEYGRRWAETLGTDFTRLALRDIALGHLDALARLDAGNPALIIEDTDIIMTSAWSRMLHGKRDPALSAIPASADLYLLFAPDTPWLDDGTRQFGGAQRTRFHTIIVQEFALRNIAPVGIAGDWSARQKEAEAAIAALLAARAQPVQNFKTT
jgi:NadR type nicotinamide-nucleotide adenylyltransferase